eukprot:CAMPEP_0119259302 /NCGR_PEP_ID=MMETSP1329-20130426/172_1 /TAXON_ID=114041 /ORGANISM="Genus nov. species nov., Strain RCC1024" /LENGTH=108 /DNA_ID=CAMNT_0007258671 /DNA_START=22 /DNA_END=349 /DNA_ORIENTATION=-
MEDGGEGHTGVAQGSPQSLGGTANSVRREHLGPQAARLRERADRDRELRALKLRLAELRVVVVWARLGAELQGAGSEARATANITAERRAENFMARVLSVARARQLNL